MRISLSHIIIFALAHHAGWPTMSTKLFYENFYFIAKLFSHVYNIYTRTYIDIHVQHGNFLCLGDSSSITGNVPRTIAGYSDLLSSGSL